MERTGRSAESDPADTGIASTIAQKVQSWEGVTAHPHRFGGVEFRAGGRELGHLHGDTLADLLLPHAAHDEAIASGRAQRHHVLPDSNWVSVFIRRPDQVQDVVDLLRIAYERAIQHPLRRRSRLNTQEANED
jgi:hypothetical protein